jgi:hypothetical protein
MMEENAVETLLPGEERTFLLIGETPVTGVGHTWLPITQLLTWGIFTRLASRRKPGSWRIAWSIEGLLRMIATLVPEWCHNLAHVLVSNWVKKPMDVLRIQFGMPRCIYHRINDPDVTPRQHIFRSLGGPIINLLLLPMGWMGKKVTKEDTISGVTANTFFQTNLFLSLVSLLPIPGIDGGPLLKWSLVERGRTIEEADETVRKVNGPLALGLGLVSSRAFAKKNLLLGFFTMMLGGISLAVFSGWLKEDDVLI